MYTSESKKELQTFLTQKRKECRVVVLPDFFLDRLINMNWNPLEFSALLSDVAKRKGGSIDGVPQIDMRGGNAINVTSALASLGATVTPIVCTSKYGLQQIKYYLKSNKIDVSHIKIRKKASITTALEFKNNEQKTNVMIRDLGSLADFSPKDLDEADYSLIADADYTCLFNWAGTLKFGTDKAQAIFGRAKKSGRGKTYYDTADPAPNLPAAPKLVETVLKSGCVDILSLNENEATIYASCLDETFKIGRNNVDLAESAMEGARILAMHLPSRIDLHTTAFSATLKGKTETVVPTFKINVLRATGAGDAWTAGNILGDGSGLSDECRLLLANAVSACYLTDPEGMHPDLSKLSIFLKNNLNLQ